MGGKAAGEGGGGRVSTWLAAARAKLRQNHLGQRMFKHTLAVTLALTVVVVPAVGDDLFGRGAFLAPLATVFGHAGQRFGQVVEAFALIVPGLVLGVGWSLLGVHLAGLLFARGGAHDDAAAYTVRAVFLLAAVLFHGVLRSYSPRLFLMVFVMMIVCFTTLLGTARAVTAALATQIVYPILTAMGIVSVVNVLVFPEFSGRFLGEATIDTLCLTESTLKAAVEWFLEPAVGPRGGGGRRGSQKRGAVLGDDEACSEEEDEMDITEPAPTPMSQISTTHEQQQQQQKQPPKPSQSRGGDDDKDGPSSLVARLARLTAAKGRLRAKLASCKRAYEECMFEVMYSVLPVRRLKPISNTATARVVQNVITLISACESKFALMGEEEEEDSEESEKKRQQQRQQQQQHSVVGESSDSDSDSQGESDDDDDDDDSSDASSRPTHRRRKKKAQRLRQILAARLRDLKPQREVAAGDAEMLESLLGRVRGPIADLLAEVGSALDLVVTGLAYCYDVERLPSGAPTPKGIRLEEMDLRADVFATAIARFDESSTEALARTADLRYEDAEVDVMPRIETFLMSSCLLSLRQVAEQTMHMLKHVRTLVDQRQARRDRKRVYFPRRINWRKWLLSGGERDAMALPETARKDLRTGRHLDPSASKDEDEDEDEDDENDDDDGDDDEAHPDAGRDEESGPARRTTRRRKPSRVQQQQEHEEEKGTERPRPRPRRPPPKAAPAPAAAAKRTTPPRKTQTPLASRARGLLADLVESAMHSEHLVFALKLAVSVYLLSWVAFYGPFNAWFNATRASWAPLQLVLVFEVAIGSSFWVFAVRAFGVVFGCAWGFAAHEISRGHRAALVVLLVCGIVPSTYVQLGTPYVKAGMISIVSMSVVAVAILQFSGPSWEIFLERLSAFLIGGSVAILVEVVVYPVRARDRLVESLSACIRRVNDMERAIAAGVERPAAPRPSRPQSARLHARFAKARDKAQNALAAAETFLPFCLAEPRLQGSFRRYEPIYREIVYVLHQIIDRMDTVVALRQAYGASVLEDLAPHVYAYRRAVAASISLTLFSVDEALVTKLPLPQFLPSCRLAQIRLVHRVRDVVQSPPPGAPPDHLHHDSRSRPTLPSRLTSGAATPAAPPRSRVNSDAIRSATRQNFLAWNATTAGLTEIVEYLEELVDLTKLLVGVNAFRSGMLDRPSYRNYVRRFQQMRGARPAASVSAATAAAAADAAAATAATSSSISRRPTIPLPHETTTATTTGTAEFPAMTTTTTTTTPLSPVSSAPGALRRRRGSSIPGFGGGGAALQRSLTAVRGLARQQHADIRRGQRRASGGAAAAVLEDDEDEGGDRAADELPISLQRVGSRIRQERTLARRRSSAAAVAGQQGGNVNGKGKA